MWEDGAKLVAMTTLSVQLLSVCNSVVRRFCDSQKIQDIEHEKESSQSFPFLAHSTSENEHGASTGKLTRTPSLVLNTPRLKSRVAGPKCGNYL